MAKKKTKRPEDRSTVAQYKHFQELKDCLASGWPSTTTKEYLIERYGPAGVPHEKAIQRWRDKHMDEEVRVLPPQIIRQHLRGIAFKVDAIAHLSRLIAILEDRVGRGIQQEVDNFDGLPLPGNDGVVEVYMRAIMNYVKVAQDLGVMKSRPPSPLMIDARTQNLNLSPEILDALQDTVREIKMLEQESVKQGLIND